MRNYILAAAALLCACRSDAQAGPPPAQGAPKLLVVISVDQFSVKLFDEYRPQFAGGFARLASGTAFVNGYQSHAGTETCPGHSTILTGDHPSRNGIAINTWHDEHIARFDPIARPDRDRAHDRSLERLHDDLAVAGDDLAIGGDDHVPRVP